MVAARTWLLSALLPACVTLFISRRVSIVSGATLFSPLLPTQAAASINSPKAQLQGALQVLETVIERWDELTLECNYADVDRELLATANKKKLLEKAGGNYQKDSSVVKNTCRSSGAPIRQYMGLSGNGPLARTRALLQQPGTLLDVLVDERQVDTFIAAAERFEQASIGANAAAFTSGVGDMSGQNGFEKGSILTSPNLKRAKELAIDARDSLRELVSLVSSTS
mmetsp:Transcript_66505/g.110588  ORF Transcript_66505/g.110588 Transcript_66505/m.110588 type:complete len:225 (+) Transcript_66505:3-677(+)